MGILNIIRLGWPIDQGFRFTFKFFYDSSLNGSPKHPHLEVRANSKEEARYFVVEWGVHHNVDFDGYICAPECELVCGSRRLKVPSAECDVLRMRVKCSELESNKEPAHVE